MPMSSDLTRKRKHSDASVANHRQRVTPSAAILPPAQTRDDECAIEIAHSSTTQVDNCTAQDQARVQYGHTYVQNQYNGLDPRPQEPFRNPKQIDFAEALAFDQMDARYNSIDPAHINTCQWLFQKPGYVQWRDPEHLNSHNGFLWIKGKAGSGKSTLMKCAFEHARKHFHDDKIASFFFNARGQPLEKSVEGMYRSLLSQILRHFPQLRSEFQANVPESLHQQGWPIPALRNHLYRAITSLGQDDALTLYIDALDECDEEDLREAIENFEELGSKALSMSITLHICFASRYYPRVTIQHCIEIQLEAQTEHQQDIRRYINGRLAIRDTAFKARLASQIESRASGVFFWVVLVIRVIKKRCDGGASHSEISESLREVPDKLQELIGAVLHSPDDALLCTMRWVLFAKRSLSLEELYFAIRTGTGLLASGFWDTSEVDRNGMEAFILATSRGLVEIIAHRTHTEAQLVHESVREYLNTGGLKDLGPCSDKTVEANNHAKLFEWCQAYLRYNVQEPFTTTIYGDTLSALDLRKACPLLLYAEDWIFHHFEISWTAGILHLDTLRDFPVQQHIHLATYYERKLHQQLLDPDHFYLSLLYLSIMHGHTDLVGALLVERAVHSPCVNNRGCTSATTSKSGVPAAKIDLNFYFEENCPSLLELAIEWCPDVVRSLLDHGADVNLDGGAPLCWAVEMCGISKCTEDVVLLLLTRGAHAQVYQTSLETTALALAVDKGNLANVTMLLEYGADANGAIGTPAVSPLLAALGHQIFTGPEEDYDKPTARVLLDHGADVFLRAGPKQISPLQYAIERYTAEYEGGDIARLLTSYVKRHVDRADLSLVSAAREMMERWNDEQ
jgi:hypothetical protein